MANQDTVKLLKECDSGAIMGKDSINEILESVKATELRDRLVKCADEHAEISEEITQYLNRENEEGKEPNVMAKGMSWVKTNVKMAVDESDKTIADLITDGCNMGVKSLTRYLNQYASAEENAKNIARRLISSEETLAADIRKFL